ncbi:MAG: hypothetical protein FWD97_04750 [Defluviitaleaceae bacterium]|nr:hypothetical protein [Defluviitaleaceae bacterium]
MVGIEVGAYRTGTGNARPYHDTVIPWRCRVFDADVMGVGLLVVGASIARPCPFLRTFLNNIKKATYMWSPFGISARRMGMVLQFFR